MEPSDRILVYGSILLLVGGCGVQACNTVAGELPAAFFEEEALRRCSEKLTADLPRPEEGKFWRTAFLPFRGDPDDRIGRRIEAALRALPGKPFRGPDRDYLRQELQKDLGPEFDAAGRDAAEWARRGLGVDAALFGSVERFVNDADRVFLKVRAGMTGSDERLPFETEFTWELPKSLFSLEYLRLRIGQTSALFRTVLWFLFLLCLPFALYPFAVTVLRRESNEASLGLLATLVALDWLACLVLNGLTFSGIWAILHIGAVGVAVFYNLLILEAFAESM